MNARSGRARLRRARLRLALSLLGLAGLLAGASGCASARAEAAPQAAPYDGAAEVEASSNTDATTPARAQPDPLTAPGDPWTDRAEGSAPPPAMAREVRLRLPSTRLEAVAPERRPALPAQARLALVSARDARLVRAVSLLLALGRELDDPRLAPVVALGPLPPERRELDLDDLALEADAQGFDLLLVDVRRGPADERDGLLVHAATGALMAVFEVRGGVLPIASGGGTGDDLLDHVGLAYARAR